MQHNEIDVLVKQRNDLVPIEIKSSKTFNSEFLRKLQQFQKIAGSRAKKGYLIYAGTQEQQIQGIKLLNYKKSFKVVQ